MYGHSYSQEPEMSQQSGAIYATGIPVATRNRGYSAGSAAARRPSAAATGQGSEGTDDEGDAAQAAGPNMRRVAHSAVEKRRRERIKDKIEVLRNLVPTCAMRPNLHKLNVLEHTIDYIYFMRKLVHKTMGERDRATYSAQQQQQQQQQQRPGGPPPHHSQAPPGAPHPRMYQQQPIQSPHPQQHHPHAAIPSQDAAHMYGMHHPPHSHHPAHVPPPHAPVPHDPHYMQFDIDLDNVNMQLLCPPPPPEHGGPAPVAASPTPHIAVPVARHAHPAASRRPAPYTVPAASPAHAPPPPTTPSVVAAAPRRALTVSPVLSAPGSVPTTTASPMRVDNLLC
ncbi:hypothetical protein HKX48_000520 [Thoreauomyces humboldtii]|nr:hypothetical protein HKX48_000520 [Thoreauomyces humboldtii]